MTINDKLAAEILYYADGLPLAIEVLGSFLYGRSISEWRSALDILKESPNKDIMDVLRLSFDGLEKNEKDIFLHIACFFNGYKDFVLRNVLNCCGLHPDIGLTILNDKSLIFYEQSMGHTIKMHSLLEELGRNIVRENSVKEPTKWSRLWLPEHLYSAISENMEKNVEAVVFDAEVFDEDVFDEDRIQVLMAESLSKLSRLKLLWLNYVDLKGSLSCLSSELRYILWDDYPLTCLPSDFQPNQLVELKLWRSNIKILWEDEKYLPKLKTLDLSGSKNLIKMPNFEKIPNLEQLYLERCVKLVHMDPSIGLLTKLVVLSLKDCKNLIIQPDIIFRINSLKEVNLSGCSNMVINQSSVEKPSSSMKWTMLPSCFSCLSELNLSFCGLSKIPNSIVSCARYLERLVLRGNNFVMLPSLKELSKLVHLDVQHCHWLKSLPELPLPAATIEQGKNKFGLLGLFFFNCPKLDQSEQSHKMILSWMTQFLRSNHKSCDFFDQLNIVIPGSEIPRWFNNRSSGNSKLHVDLSPIMQHNNMNNFIGIACYVAFSTTLIDYPLWTTTVTWSPQILLDFEIKGSYSCPVNINKDFIIVDSNHVWLCFIPLEALDLTLNEDIDAIMQTYINQNNGNGLRVEVKSFGYHWVSKRDLQVPMHSGDFLAEKNKILEIE